jgi:hypothetical protein
MIGRTDAVALRGNRGLRKQLASVVFLGHYMDGHTQTILPIEQSPEDGIHTGICRQQTAVLVDEHGAPEKLRF